MNIEIPILKLRRSYITLIDIDSLYTGMGPWLSGRFTAYYCATAFLGDIMSCSGRRQEVREGGLG